MSYGLQIRNSDGVLVVDTNKRSMEAVEWGTMSIPDRGNYRLDLPTTIDAPIVFIRKPPTALIIRGSQKEDGGGLHCNFSADRDVDVEYMIAGFRNSVPTEAQTGYGCSVFDEDGKLTFSTNLAYPRFPYRSITLSNTAMNPSDFAVYTMISSGSPAYQHPAWGDDDWLYWNPMTFWSKDSGANWHLGLWFGSFGGDTRRFEIGRVDLSTSLAGNWLGWGPGVPPGTNMAPDGLLSCNFVPPVSPA